MKTSIYIPADNTSMSKLKTIVSMYNNGTVKPDEIVINVFGVYNEEYVSVLRSVQELGFDNVIIYARKLDGEMADNRNYALQHTTGDIVLYHNPKTYPSIKRVELIKKYFEENDVYVLHHNVYNYDIYTDNAIKTDNINCICASELYSRYFPFGHRESVWSYTKHYGQEFGAKAIDMDSVCVLRGVLAETKWKKPFEIELYQGFDDGMCYDFCLDTLYKYKKSGILDIPLTIV